MMSPAVFDAAGISFSRREWFLNDSISTVLSLSTYRADLSGLIAPQFGHFQSVYSSGSRPVSYAKSLL